MNTTTRTSVLGTLPARPSAASSGTTKALASLMLAAGVATLVVGVDQWIDPWAETHVLAAWTALWLVAVVAIAALRGVTRLLAQNLMHGLDAWSANVARRRADERLWAMAQSDSRMMRDLQAAMDRAEEAGTPADTLTTLKARRVARMVHTRQYYI